MGSGAEVRALACGDDSPLQKSQPAAAVNVISPTPRYHCDSRCDDALFSLRRETIDCTALALFVATDLAPT
jgi:hypothetical protein